MEKIGLEDLKTDGTKKSHEFNREMNLHCAGCSMQILPKSPEVYCLSLFINTFSDVHVYRDYNAAMNILNRGLRKLGREPPQVKPLREGTATDKKQISKFL